MIFRGCFNETIMPLALVGYKIIIANLALRDSLAISIILHPTRACGIIVKYAFKDKRLISVCFIYKC